MLLIVEPNPAMTSKLMFIVARQYFLVPLLKLDINNVFEGRNYGIIGNLKIKNNYNQT